MRDYPHDLTNTPEDAAALWGCVQQDLQDLGKGEILRAAQTAVPALLDLGCGRGTLVRYLREKVGICALGADRRSDGGQWFFRRDTNEGLPFADDTFLIVYSRGIFDPNLYGNQPESVFREVRRVLRVGGLYVLHDGNLPMYRDQMGFQVLRDSILDMGEVVLEKTA